MASYRLLWKITNLQDINLKFSGLIHDINNDDPVKFGEACPEVAFPKAKFWSLIYIRVMSNFFPYFVDP